MDGANIEIREEVGAENFFLFGMTAAEVQALSAPAAISPMDLYESEPELRQVIDLIRDGFFSRGDSEQFRAADRRSAAPGSLHGAGRLPVLCRLPAAGRAGLCATAERWTRMSILNVARSGKFSSDRTIREYCGEIWQAKSVPVQLMHQTGRRCGCRPR